MAVAVHAGISERSAAVESGVADGGQLRFGGSNRKAAQRGTVLEGTTVDAGQRCREADTTQIRAAVKGVVAEGSELAPLSVATGTLYTSSSSLSITFFENL